MWDSHKRHRFAKLPGEKYLFGGFGGKRFDDGDIGSSSTGRLWRPGDRRGVVGDPDFAGGVFGDENLQWQISARLGEASISGVPLWGFRKSAAWYWHFQAGTGGFPAMVNNGEKLHALGCRIACSRATVASTESCWECEECQVQDSVPWKSPELQMNYSPQWV